ADERQFARVVDSAAAQPGRVRLDAAVPDFRDAGVVEAAAAAAVCHIVLYHAGRLDRERGAVPDAGPVGCPVGTHLGSVQYDGADGVVDAPAEVCRIVPDDGGTMHADDGIAQADAHVCDAAAHGRGVAGDDSPVFD